MKFRTTTRPTALEEAFARAKREKLRNEPIRPNYRQLAEWEDCQISIGMERDLRRWTIEGEDYARLAAIWRMCGGDIKKNPYQFAAHRPSIRKRYVERFWVYNVEEMVEAILEAKSGKSTLLQKWVSRKKHMGCRPNGQTRCKAG
jgi:hypothetical protein